jgi:hypothetical protein
MAGRHKHKNATEDVQPDLPITPMLDMSFQLMAFFIFTFRPAPTEGQIAMALPISEGNPNATAVPDVSDQKPVSFVVKVFTRGADDRPTGGITKLTIRDREKVGDEQVVSTEVPADKHYEAYEAALKRRKGEIGGRPSKLTLEFEDGILHEYMVRLLDVGIQAGFEDIAPVPLNPKK